MSLTVIYYTENKLEEPLFSLCQKKLKEVAPKIVSVSHKPIDLGTNICVGEQKPCWLTLYKQLLLGLKAADTKYVAMAEHDCLYTKEHFDWIPPRDDTFYYNENCWLVQWGGNHPELNGVYSRYWTERLALSQLICNRDLFIQTIELRLEIIDKTRSIRGIEHIYEPGLTNAQKWAESGRPAFLKQYFAEELAKEKYKTFETKLPNLDIRHSTNFTGPKRGRNRTYHLEPWGKFEDLIYGGNTKQADI